MENLWSLPDPLPPEELFDSLLQTPDLRIERIVSTGQITPPGTWLAQDQDEWVVLLRGEATLGFSNGVTQRLAAGDFLLIAARTRHRVDHTSRNPPCIWLAIHGCLKVSGQS